MRTNSRHRERALVTQYDSTLSALALHAKAGSD
jgi:hypothetical protein